MKTLEKRKAAALRARRRARLSERSRSGGEAFAHASRTFNACHLATVT